MAPPIPSFSLTATETTVTFHVTYGEGYTYYRLFFRRSDSPGSMLVDGLSFYDVTEDFTYTVYNLTPGTEYAANVYYSTNTTLPENTPLGAQTITTPLNVRPSDWSWTTSIVKGATVPKYGESLAPVTAAEWDLFCSRINTFRAYKGLSAYSFTFVTQGTPMTAVIINQAITAISDIPGHGTLPTPSNAILASFWQELAAALNAIT